MNIICVFGDNRKVYNILKRLAEPIAVESVSVELYRGHKGIAATYIPLELLALNGDWDNQTMANELRIFEDEPGSMDIICGCRLHRPEHQPDCQAGGRRRPRISGRHVGDPGEIGADMAVTKTHPITTPTSGATMRSAVPATGSVKNTACPSSFPAVTRARATLSTRRNRTVPATRQSCVPPSTGSCQAASAWRICSAASSGKGTN